MNLKNRFLKFIGAGVINTIASYLLYVIVVLFLSYQVSYAISFIFGIILSFILNTKYVFEVKQTLKKFVLFPFVYLVQYLLGAFMMNYIIEIIEVNKFLAPLVVTVCLLPVSYLLSKKILVRN